MRCSGTKSGVVLEPGQAENHEENDRQNQRYSQRRNVDSDSTETAVKGRCNMYTIISERHPLSSNLLYTTKNVHNPGISQRASITVA